MDKKNSGNHRLLLELDHVSVGFPIGKREISVVTREVSFQVCEGEALGIVGESGSGKSVSMLAALGLLGNGGHVVSGNIRFYPEKEQCLVLNQFTEKQLCEIRGDDISMIFQEPMTSLNPVMTIGQQVEEMLVLHGNCPKEERRSKVLSMLSEAGLPDTEALYGKYPHELSGGMRQRVMIAMAMICRPKLLIADEPTTALDVTIQAKILKLLKKFQQQYGTTIILISHDLGVIRNVCSRAVVMCAGEVVEQGNVETLFENPEKEYTKRLLAAALGKGGILRRENAPQENIIVKARDYSVYYEERAEQLFRQDETVKQEEEAEKVENQKSESGLEQPIEPKEIQNNLSEKAEIQKENRQKSESELEQPTEPKETQNNLSEKTEIQKENRQKSESESEQPTEPKETQNNLSEKTEIQKENRQKFESELEQPTTQRKNQRYKIEMLKRRFRQFLSGKTKRRIVNKVSFDVYAGEIVGIVGESGCGKSTLAKAVAGLNPLTEGELFLDCKQPQMVFQDPYGSLNPSKTIGWLLTEPLRLKHCGTKEEQRKAAEQMLEKVGLGKEYYHRYPNTLSGGQRQRVAIAMAIMLKQKLIVLDEPVSALDVTVQEQILILLVELQKEFGLSYLFISHDMNVIHRICDRVFVMYQGEIVEKGNTDAVFENPQHEYTKKLLSARL